MANGNNYGKLKIQVTEGDTYIPIENASIEISTASNPERIIDSITTDNSGITDDIELTAPPIEYSMEPSDNQPYSEYNIKIQAEGFDNIFISGASILPDELSIQYVTLNRTSDANTYNPIVLGGNTLWEQYPSKIAENEVKSENETGQIVLSRVVIPETIVVHDGVPGDTTAKNYYVKYKDYIKNVASSEVYATWPDACLRANILAIMSFTLNRVYTEWYRGKGYDFTITSSTAYDQKWIYGQTIYEKVSRIVDEQFNNYLSRPGVTQPILTQYCDGRRVSCPNWLSQWGSKQLADNGLSTSEILKYYYGNSIYINSADTISGIPSSYPGILNNGSSGQKVRQLQNQLNRISQNYPAIPKVTADGIYGQNTVNAVRQFQRIFNLPATGTTDYATWYKISQIYVGVSKIAELQ